MYKVVIETVGVILGAWGALKTAPLRLKSPTDNQSLGQMIREGKQVVKPQGSSSLPEIKAKSSREALT